MRTPSLLLKSTPVRSVPVQLASCGTLQWSWFIMIKPTRIVYQMLRNRDKFVSALTSVGNSHVQSRASKVELVYIVPTGTQPREQRFVYPKRTIHILYYHHLFLAIHSVLVLTTCILLNIFWLTHVCFRCLTVSTQVSRLLFTFNWKPLCSNSTLFTHTVYKLRVVWAPGCRFANTTLDTIISKITYKSR
jgi:hypothetical protein